MQITDIRLADVTGIRFNLKTDSFENEENGSVLSFDQVKEIAANYRIDMTQMAHRLIFDFEYDVKKLHSHYKNNS